MTIGLLIMLFANSILRTQSDALERLSGEASWETGRKASVLIVRIAGGLMVLFGLLVATS